MKSTFDLMPDLERVVHQCEAYRITPQEIASKSDLHYNTARNCYHGKDNVALNSYKRFIEAAEKIVEQRREIAKGR